MFRIVHIDVINQCFRVISDTRSPGLGNLRLLCPFTAALLPFFFKPGECLLNLAPLPLVKDKDLFLLPENTYWEMK